MEQERSIGEQLVINKLISNHVEYEIEKTFNEFKSPDGQHYTFDFYLPNAEVLIECQGHQHFKPGNKLPKEIKRFERTVKRDELKKVWCKENGYKLFCIKSGKAATAEIELLFEYFPDIFRIKRRTKIYRFIIRILRKKFPEFVNIL